VPSLYIAWEEIDASSARATMSYGGVTAAAMFHFDERDQLVDMTVDHYNNAKGRILPWSTPIGAYAESGGCSTIGLPAPEEGGQLVGRAGVARESPGHRRLRNGRF